MENKDAETRKTDDLPTLLIIADDHICVTYANAAGILDYNHIPIHGEWHREDEITEGTHGPLNSKFMKALIERDPKKYDGVIVDLLCDDLIEPLRQGGFKGSIVGITSGREPIEGANDTVDLFPMDTFSSRLKKTLERLIKKR